MATLKAIAQELGVSIHTVSDVLNCGDMRYSAATRKRIHEVAKRMNYRVNRQARVLAGAKSGMLGMIKSISIYQEHVETILLAGEAIHQSGFELLSSDIHWHKDGFARAIDAMLDSRVEGVLLVNVDSIFAREKAFRRMIASGIPVVTIGSDHFPGIPRVSVDQYQATSLITSHLLSLGYRRIAMMTLPEAFHNQALIRREAGFRETIARFPGLTEKDAEIIHLDYSKQETDTITDSYKPTKIQMAKILKRKVLPEAILCLNDYAAVAAIQACQEAGVRIPEDIALTGMGNAFASQYACPPLTSLSAPIDVMVTKAVDLLLRLVKEEKLPRNQNLIELPCELVIRQSCGAHLRKSK